MDAALQNLHKMFMKDTRVSVAHLNRLMEELERMAKCVVFKLVQSRLLPMNQIDCIEQRIKSSLCFRQEINIVKNEFLAFLLKCWNTYLNG